MEKALAAMRDAITAALAGYSFEGVLYGAAHTLLPVSYRCRCPRCLLPG